MEITNVTPAVVTTVDKSSADKRLDDTRSVEQSKGSSNVSPNSDGALTKIDETVIEELNKTLNSLNTGIYFSLDENTQSSVVKVIDKSTDEVIRQYPTEDSLRVLKNIQEYLTTVNQRGVSEKESLTGTLFSEII